MGLPYQKLIDLYRLYLLDCAKKRKKLAMTWVAEQHQQEWLVLDRLAPIGTNWKGAAVLRRFLCWT